MFAACGCDGGGYGGGYAAPLPVCPPRYIIVRSASAYGGGSPVISSGPVPSGGGSYQQGPVPSGGSYQQGPAPSSGSYSEGSVAPASVASEAEEQQQPAAEVDTTQDGYGEASSISEDHNSARESSFLFCSHHVHRPPTAALSQIAAYS